jgi:hypothetical protein
MSGSGQKKNPKAMLQKSPSKRPADANPMQAQQKYTEQQVNVGRRLGTLVTKRHRSLLHMQNALTEEGTMWMNCIKVTKADIMQLILTNAVPGAPQHEQGYFQRTDSRQSLAMNRWQPDESHKVYMKLKIERYYNLGVSLSRCLGLFDCVNFVQYLLNLLEEYEVYIVLQNQH